MSRLGGAGFGNMPGMYGLGQSGFDAGADRLAQAQRDLSNIILTVSEKRKDRQAQRKQQKRAISAQRKNMFTSLGIQAGGAVATGAVLGALPGAEVPGLAADADIAQVAGTGSTGEFLPVTPEQTASMAQVDLSQGIQSAGKSPVQPSTAMNIGGAKIPGINTKYAFGDSMGGSIGKGAALGLAGVFAPTLSQSVLQAPLQAAQLGLGYARLGQNLAISQAGLQKDYDIAGQSSRDRRDIASQRSTDYNARTGTMGQGGGLSPNSMLNFLGNTGSIIAPDDIRGGVEGRLRTELGLGAPAANTGLPPIGGSSTEAPQQDLLDSLATDLDKVEGPDRKLGVLDEYVGKGLGDVDYQWLRKRILKQGQAPMGMSP